MSLCPSRTPLKNIEGEGESPVMGVFRRLSWGELSRSLWRGIEGAKATLQGTSDVQGEVLCKHGSQLVNMHGAPPTQPSIADTCGYKTKKPKLRLELGYWVLLLAHTCCLLAARRLYMSKCCPLLSVVRCIQLTTLYNAKIHWMRLNLTIVKKTKLLKYARKFSAKSERACTHGCRAFLLLNWSNLSNQTT